MADKLEKLGAQDGATQKLYDELEARLDDLAQKGAVDLKAMCSSDRNSSTVDKLWALNNVLRRSAEGRTEVSIIEG